MPIPSTVGIASSTRIVPNTCKGLNATSCRIDCVAGFIEPQNARLKGVNRIEPSIENAAIVTDRAGLPCA